MGLSVRARGDCVSTFRWTEVRFMETMAAWVPTTPEMEVKLLFGAHIWDAAQHADALGRRTHELRLPLQHSTEAAPGYVVVLAELAATTETARRVGGIYDAFLPDLLARFDSYLGRVDHLLDAPTVRILERIATDVGRMIKESQALRDELPVLRVGDDGWLRGLGDRLAGAGDIVQYRSALSTDVNRSSESQPA